MAATAAVALVIARSGWFAGEHAARRSTAASQSSTSGSASLFRTAAFTAMVPRAWRSQVVTASRAGEAVRFSARSPAEVSATVYVFGTQVTAAADARAIERRVSRHHGFTQLSWGLVRLKAAGPAWRLGYTVAGREYVVYTFTTCPAAKLVIVVGAGPRVGFADLSSAIGSVAGSVRPRC